MTLNEYLIKNISEIPKIKRGYAIGDILHIGKHSTVFSALDRYRQRSVAMKFCNPDLNDVERYLRFVREASVGLHLRGKQIVPELVQSLTPIEVKFVSSSGEGYPVVFEFFTTQLGWFTLRDYIQSSVRCPVYSLKLFRHIFLKVIELHNHGIFHRD